MSISIEVTQHSKLQDFDFNNIVFGKNFSDHMLIAEYFDDQWHQPKIVPFQNLSLSPGTTVFHYAQSIFEGMKAHKNINGDIVLFRPEENWKRMNMSAERIAMPTIPYEIFMDGLKTLITLDKNWVPNSENASLYVRPFMIATEPYIGVKISDRYQFIIITGPVGGYYSGEVKVYATASESRAVKGVGKAKFSGNYAASLYPANEVKKYGYKDLLWLDSEHHKYIQEVGAMNIFFVINGKIVTPELDGGFLEGITRASIIQVSKDLGYDVIEKRLSIDEIVDAYNNGSLTEMFGTGTAAVVTFVSGFGYLDKDYPLDASKFEVAPKLKDTLLSIQKGAQPDTHNWVMKVL